MSNPTPVQASRARTRGIIPNICFVALALLAATFGLTGPQSRAAGAATGTIEGRVLNLNDGRYLNSALVKVEGSAIQTLTNDYGEYKLSDVPAGSVKLTSSYTGQESTTVSVLVEAGKTATKDIGMSTAKEGAAGDSVLVLDQYVVSQNRFKNAQEIAINDERRSVNVKDVMATDALGYIPSGNVGEFVKFLPGVQTLYGGTDAFGAAGIGGINQSTASQISMRGFSSSETSITIDGVPVAGVGPGQLTRTVGLDMMSINNASRIEAIKVPTPDMDGDSAGGVINLVTKSAFEYAKPSYSGMVGASFVTGDGSIFKKQPGPANKPTYHTLPNANLSITVPVNKSFGFSVSLASANNYSPNYYVQTKWQTTNTFYTTGTNWTTSVATGTINVHAPLDSPYQATWVTTNSTGTTRYYNVGNAATGTLADLTNPFVRQALDEQNPWTEKRLSGGLKLDWKPFNDLQISTGYTGSTYNGINVDYRLTLSDYYPMEWGSDYELGRPYEAARRVGTYNYNSLNFGNKIEEEVTSRDKSGVTHTGFIRFTYDHGPWSVSGVAGASQTNMDLDDLKNGHMYRVYLDGSGIVGNVNFHDIVDGTPNQIDVYDRSGAPIDWHQIDTWQFSDIKVGSAASKQMDKTGDYKFDVRRDLDFLPFKLALKVGVSRKSKEQNKSGLGTGYSMKYIGVADTAFIDSITDTSYKRTAGQGFAKNQTWISDYKMYDIFVAHPELFSLTPNNADGTPDMSYPVNNYRSIIGQTKAIKEVTDSAYVMLDGSLFNERFSYVIGAKQGRSSINGTQPFIDSKWNYIKNPDGSLYTDSIYLSGVRLDWLTSRTTAAPLAPAATPGGPTAFTTGGFLADTALLGRLQAAGIAYPDHLMLSTSGTSSGLSTGDTSRGNLEAAQRSLYLGQANASRTNPVQPSVITSFRITENLVFKPSWSREVSLPALDAGNNSTAGLLGSYSINPGDPSSATYTNAGGEGTISESNAGLKPRIVNSFNGQLAYYNKYGNVSAAYYYKFIENEWITNTYTSNSPDFAQQLANLGLDYASFSNWTVTTTENSDQKSHASGYELSFRQNFGYLGDFMGHFNAFGNYSHKDVTQPNKPGIVVMTVFPSNTWAGGINFSAYRCSLTAKMTFQNEVWNKNGTVNYGLNSDGSNRQVQLYQVFPKMYLLDLDFAYQISQHFTFFISGKNVMNSHRQVKQYDALNLLPEYARVTGNYEFGVQVATGVQLSF